MKKFLRIVSMLLVVGMVAAMVPAISVSATETTTPTTPVYETTGANGQKVYTVPGIIDDDDIKFDGLIDSNDAYAFESTTITGPAAYVSSDWESNVFKSASDFSADALMMAQQKFKYYWAQSEDYIYFGFYNLGAVSEDGTKWNGRNNHTLTFGYDGKTMSLNYGNGDADATGVRNALAGGTLKINNAAYTGTNPIKSFLQGQYRVKDNSPQVGNNGISYGTGSGQYYLYSEMKISKADLATAWGLTEIPDDFTLTFENRAISYLVENTTFTSTNNYVNRMFAIYTGVVSNGTVYPNQVTFNSTMAVPTVEMDVYNRTDVGYTVHNVTYPTGYSTTGIVADGVINEGEYAYGYDVTANGGTHKGYAGLWTEVNPSSAATPTGNDKTVFDALIADATMKYYLSADDKNIYIAIDNYSGESSAKYISRNHFTIRLGYDPDDYTKFVHIQPLGNGPWVEDYSDEPAGSMNKVAIYNGTSENASVSRSFVKELILHKTLEGGVEGVYDVPGNWLPTEGNRTQIEIVLDKAMLLEVIKANDADFADATELSDEMFFSLFTRADDYPWGSHGGTRIGAAVMWTGVQHKGEFGKTAKNDFYYPDVVNFGTNPDAAKTAPENVWDYTLGHTVHNVTYDANYSTTGIVADGMISAGEYAYGYEADGHKGYLGTFDNFDTTAAPTGDARKEIDQLLDTETMKYYLSEDDDYIYVAIDNYCGMISSRYVARNSYVVKLGYDVNDPTKYVAIRPDGWIATAPDANGLYGFETNYGGEGGVTTPSINTGSVHKTVSKNVVQMMTMGRFSKNATTGVYDVPISSNYGLPRVDNRTIVEIVIDKAELLKVIKANDAAFANATELSDTMYFDLLTRMDDYYSGTNLTGRTAWANQWTGVQLNSTQKALLNTTAISYPDVVIFGNNANSDDVVKDYEIDLGQATHNVEAPAGYTTVGITPDGVINEGEYAYSYDVQANGGFKGYMGYGDDLKTVGGPTGALKTELDELMNSETMTFYLSEDAENIYIAIDNFTGKTDKRFVSRNNYVIRLGYDINDFSKFIAVRPVSNGTFYDDVDLHMGQHSSYPQYSFDGGITATKINNPDIVSACAFGKEAYVNGEFVPFTKENSPNGVGVPNVANRTQVEYVINKAALLESIKAIDADFAGATELSDSMYFAILTRADDSNYTTLLGDRKQIGTLWSGKQLTNAEKANYFTNDLYIPELVNFNGAVTADVKDHETQKGQNTYFVEPGNTDGIKLDGFINEGEYTYATEKHTGAVGYATSYKFTTARFFAEATETARLAALNEQTYYFAEDEDSIYIAIADITGKINTRLNFRNDYKFRIGFDANDTSKFIEIGYYDASDAVEGDSDAFANGVVIATETMNKQAPNIEGNGLMYSVDGGKTVAVIPTLSNPVFEGFAVTKFSKVSNGEFLGQLTGNGLSTQDKAEVKTQIEMKLNKDALLYICKQFLGYDADATELPNTMYFFSGSKMQDYDYALSTKTMPFIIWNGAMLNETEIIYQPDMVIFNHSDKQVACAAGGECDFSAKIAERRYYKATNACSVEYYRSCTKCGAAGAYTFGVDIIGATHDFSAELALPQYLVDECLEFMTYYKSCTACGMASTETFTTDVPGTHSYTYTVSGDKHVAVCTSCGKTLDPVHHVYDRKVALDKFIKTEGTCVSAGVYYLSCACGEFVANANNVFEYECDYNNHTWGAGLQSNATHHWAQCTDCLATDTPEAHKFASSSAVECQTCGYVRTIDTPELPPVDTEPEDTTAPEETTPPEDTTPAETTPAETTPAETTPAETTPAETTPAETTPAETEPAETTPAETEPAKTKKGCGGTVSFMGVALIAALGACGIVATKKKDEE